MPGGFDERRKPWSRSLSEVQQTPQAARYLASLEAFGVLQQQFDQGKHARNVSKVHAMSREIPYQPMKGPQKQVSQTDMLAILEKHAQRTGIPVSQPKAQTVVEDPPASGVQSGLQWNKPEKGATGVRTVCGRYSCSKVTCNGKQTYEVWRLVPNHWFKPIAIGLDSFEAGKRAADEDLKQTPWAKSA